VHSPTTVGTPGTPVFQIGGSSGPTFRRAKRVLSIDQIVLSPAKYRRPPPGTLKKDVVIGPR
jgi:hypothetical protein